MPKASIWWSNISKRWSKTQITTITNRSSQSMSSNQSKKRVAHPRSILQQYRNLLWDSLMQWIWRRPNSTQRKWLIKGLRLRRLESGIIWIWIWWQQRGRCIRSICLVRPISLTCQCPMEWGRTHFLNVLATWSPNNLQIVMSCSRSIPRQLRTKLAPAFSSTSWFQLLWARQAPALALRHSKSTRVSKRLQMLTHPITSGLQNLQKWLLTWSL